MKSKITALCSTIMALVLELLPYGAVCNFANPEGEHWRRTYSYFDLLPFGYANFAPFITAILTCVLLFFVLISLMAKKPMRKTILILSVITAAISAMPLMLGIHFYSFVGALITAALLITALSVYFQKSADKV